jgi:hypothetical protein
MASEGAAKMYGHLRLCCWKNLYVVTLKSFNRIFDYSLVTVRALAIEFFWAVALFCSAPMELGFGSSPLVRFQAGRCPKDRQCRHRCPIAAPTRPAPMSA